MRLSEWILNFLVSKSVRHLFTLQGGFSMYLNDAIGHDPRIKPIYMLHESGCAFASAGYAHYTGSMGVCVITSGLAQTNALSGIASAYSDYLPVLVISGDVKRDAIYNRERNHLRQGGQQDVPITKIARSVTKYIALARNPRQCMHILEYAWNIALETPLGPVWIDIPLDVQAEEV